MLEKMVDTSLPFPLSTDYTKQKQKKTKEDRRGTPGFCYLITPLSLI